MKLALLLIFGILLQAKTCDSITASSYGDWKPVKSAPHDGTVVEMMETYGVAPWYGIFKWTKDQMSVDQTGKQVHFSSTTASWVQIDQPGNGVGEDECLFWRPYKGSITKYVDPTGGAQKSIAYWCVALHRPYDRKTDSCK